ncbi:hypothetical protein BGZ59_003301, partial [Podila verticillata]
TTLAALCLITMSGRSLTFRSNGCFAIVKTYPTVLSTQTTTSSPGTTLSSDIFSGTSNTVVWIQSYMSLPSWQSHAFSKSACGALSMSALLSQKNFGSRTLLQNISRPEQQRDMLVPTYHKHLTSLCAWNRLQPPRLHMRSQSTFSEHLQVISLSAHARISICTGVAVSRLP